MTTKQKTSRLRNAAKRKIHRLNPDGTFGSWLAERTIWGLVLLLAVTQIAIIGILNSLTSKIETTAALKAQEPPAPTAAVEGFAHRYVIVFLESGRGDEEALGEFYMGSVDLRQVRARTVMRTATSSVEETGPNRWNVTVAVEVAEPLPQELESEPGTTEDVQLSEEVLAAISPQWRYFAAEIEQQEQAIGFGYRALDLPKEVGAPQVVDAELPVDCSNRPEGDELEAAAEAFLASLLTGEGDIERVVVVPESPASRMRPITPPPYADVTLQCTTRRTLDNGVFLFAGVLAESTTGAHIFMHYSLLLQEERGLWFVFELLPGPTSAGSRP